MKVLLSWCSLLLMLLTLIGCERSLEQPSEAQKPLILETHIRKVEIGEDKLQTRFGKLEIVRSEQDLPPDTLLLNGKQVFRAAEFYLSLHYYIKQNQRDLVLLGSNCGGTGCPQNQFSFLILDEDKAPQILKNDEFYAYPDDVAIDVDGERLLLDLGFQAGQHKLAILRGESLGVELKTVPKSFLGEENCRWLYDEALLACKEYQETDTQCKAPHEGFAGYLMRGVAAVAEHSGFTQEAFERRCEIACKSSKLVDYPTFAKEVCSK